MKIRRFNLFMAAFVLMTQFSEPLALAVPGDLDEKVESISGKGDFESPLQIPALSLNSEYSRDTDIRVLDLRCKENPEESIIESIDQMIKSSIEEKLQIIAEIKISRYNQISEGLIYKYLFDGVLIEPRQTTVAVMRDPSQYVNVLIDVRNWIFSKNIYEFKDKAEVKMAVDSLHSLMAKSEIPQKSVGNKRKRLVGVINISGRNQCELSADALAKVQNIVEDKTFNSEGGGLGYRAIMLRLNPECTLTMNDLLSGSESLHVKLSEQFIIKDRVIGPDQKSLYILVGNKKRQMLDIHSLPEDKAKKKTLGFIEKQFLNFASDCRVTTGKGNCVLCEADSGVLNREFPNWVRDSRVTTYIDSVQLMSEGVSSDSAYEVKFKPMEEVQVNSAADTEIDKVVSVAVRANRSKNPRIVIKFNHETIRNGDHLDDTISKVKSMLVKRLFCYRTREAFKNKAICFKRVGNMLVMWLDGEAYETIHEI